MIVFYPKVKANLVVSMLMNVNNKLMTHPHIKDH